MEPLRNDDVISKTVFESDELIFREMDVADLDFVAAMLSDPTVMEFYPRCYSREEAAGWIDRQRDRYKRNRHGFWLVIDRATNRPVAQAGLVMVELDGTEEVGLGYIIPRNNWGQGLGNRIAAAVVDYAFRELALERVICPIRPENIASQRISIRIGMQPTRLTTYGGFDHLIYAIERSDR